jgi:1,2-diacylglycerol-3-alpha-glucose alpha-1,2-glucosyltransferase
MINNQPKITLYCEYLKFFNSLPFGKLKRMGFLVSYWNQKEILKKQEIYFTENLKEDTDIFQANTQGLRTLWLIKKFKRRGKKTIVYAHATAEELHNAFRIFHLFSNLYKKYLSYVYGSADMVLCPSEYTAGLLQKNYAIPKEKTLFISNGVKVSDFTFDAAKREIFRKENNLNPQDLAVLNVAIVIKKKGIETFIALAKNFPEIKFNWCGKIFNRFLAPKIPPCPKNISFRGYVDDVKSFYSGSDIFFFPSYEENQGISVLEAAVAGLPIIVRDIPVYSVWLQDGYHCLKAQTEEEFKDKMELLIKDSQLRKTLGENARQMAVADHSLEAVGEKLKNLYLTLLK